MAKKQPLRATLSAHEWSLLRLETDGRPLQLPDVSARFLEAQRASIDSPTAKRVEQPHWARRIVATNGGVEQILHEAAARALRTPDRATLVEVQAVINDIGRGPNNASAITKVVTQENLDKILK